jgi:serine O-acetyltransferase
MPDSTASHLQPDVLWRNIKTEAQAQEKHEPLLSGFFQQSILTQASFEAAISFTLAQKLQNEVITAEGLRALFQKTLLMTPALMNAIAADIVAIKQRDCACNYYYQALCFFKGFHALATYRIMHELWLQNHRPLALHLQNRVSAILAVDIHPAAQIGQGVMLDHATGIVIGETAVVGNNVSIMQAVTLGGTGKESGDRHPKIGNDVLISVGATVLGNISIGEGAQIAAGSVVLDAVAPHTLVAGVPAKTVGKAHSAQPALIMDHTI